GMPRFDNRGRPESVAMGLLESAAKLSLAEPFLKESSRRSQFSADIAKCNCTADGVKSEEARNFALDTISDSTLGYLAAPAEKTKPELFQALQLQARIWCESVSDLARRHASCFRRC